MGEVEVSFFFDFLKEDFEMPSLDEVSKRRISLSGWSKCGPFFKLHLDYECIIGEGFHIKEEPV